MTCRRSFLLSFPVLVIACGGASRQGDASGANVSAPAATGTPLNPGPSLPPVGRSLFDLVLGDAGGGATSIAVPYPFEQLTTFLAERASSSIVSALIPKGRSLLREANAANRFAYPRAIVGFAREQSTGPSAAPVNAKARGVVGGRLYVAYMEPAARLEVISYNEEAGRYEFEIVSGYGPGLTPSVEYANRAAASRSGRRRQPTPRANDDWARAVL